MMLQFALLGPLIKTSDDSELPVLSWKKVVLVLPSPAYCGKEAG